MYKRYAFFNILFGIIFLSLKVQAHDKKQGAIHSESLCAKINQTEKDYYFRSREARKLRDEIGISLNNTCTHEIGSPYELRIAEINAIYAQLPRSEISADDLVELKNLILHWRYKTKQFLLSETARFYRLMVSNRKFDSRNKDLISAFIELNTFLQPEELRLIAKASSNFRDPIWMRLVTMQGNANLYRTEFKKLLEKDTSKLVGPRNLLSFAPVESSGQPFEEWSKDPELSHYAFTPDGYSVLYRGLNLKSGDIIVGDSNDLSEGDYSSLNREPSIYGHMALFIIVEKEGKKFPTIFEVYEKGIRGIPLNSFFSPQMLTKAEVYRLKDQPADWTTNLSVASGKVLQNHYRFNFFAGAGPTDGIICTTISSLFFGCTTVSPIKSNTTQHEKCLANLKALGLGQNPVFLGINEHIQSSRTQYVGMVDNSMWERQLATDLVNTRVFDLFKNSKLKSLDKFKMLYETEKNLIHQINNGSLIGKMAMKALGYNSMNFPAGPPELLAFLDTMYDADIIEASQKILDDKEYQKAISQLSGPFSISGFKADPKIKAIVDRHTQPIEDWFVK